KRIDLKPQHQRRLRWSPERKSRLIESFLINVPIPPIYLAEIGYGKYSVIDGKQRLFAISDYFTEKFSLVGLQVFAELNGMIFGELPSELQSILTVRPSLRCIILLKQSNPDIKFEVFERLNTGGVTLNPQEIRNNAYRGKLNNLIHELSSLPLFRKLLRINNPESSYLYQQMRDCELVLRFLAIHYVPNTPPSRALLNSFMGSHQDPKETYLKELRSLFEETLKAVEAAFDDYAFIRWNEKTSKWSQRFVAAVYDAQMLSCVGKDPKILKKNRSHIIKANEKLFKDDPDFMESVVSSTLSPARYSYRVDKIKALIEKYS
ncbi:MAG: DUF262 domain-containing protein, partial [Deltaproteobacteria bacterium]|nr:DUF262 domain-containing protein [Deltaproteobacteria bacterium]